MVWALVSKDVGASLDPEDATGDAGDAVPRINKLKCLKLKTAINYQGKKTILQSIALNFQIGAYGRMLSFFSVPIGYLL